jgi:hypothetical protein
VKIKRRKIIIRKEVRVNPGLLVTTRIIMIFLMVLIVGLSVFSVIYINRLEAQMPMAETLSAIEQKAAEINIPDKVLVEYYKELSDKTDNAISIILSFVGVAVTFFTIFGGIIAFRTPNEINKKMSELEEIQKESQNRIREARYYAEISNALCGKRDTLKMSIDKITSIINE